MRIDVLDVGFDNISMDEALKTAYESICSRTGGYIVTPNPEIVWMCRDNDSLKEALEGSELALPDGVGITYAAKILGTPLRQRLPGIDFASALLEKLSSEGGTVYLFGAKPGVAQAAAERISREYRGLGIAGVSDGYFEDDAPIIRKINAASPDLLLVCLGAPKQELWMARNRDRLDVGLMLGLGGALDVYAGVAGRAPERWQRLGLEWLYRLIKQPSRIKRMIKLPAFLFAVIGRRLIQISDRNVESH